VREVDKSEGQRLVSVLAAVSGTRVKNGIGREPGFREGAREKFGEDDGWKRGRVLIVD